MPHSVFHEIFSSRSLPNFESAVRALDCYIKKDVPKFILSMMREDFLLFFLKNFGEYRSLAAPFVLLKHPIHQIVYHTV